MFILRTYSRMLSWTAAVMEQNRKFWITATAVVLVAYHWLLYQQVSSFSGTLQNSDFLTRTTVGWWVAYVIFGLFAVPFVIAALRQPKDEEDAPRDKLPPGVAMSICVAVVTWCCLPYVGLIIASGGSQASVDSVQAAAVAEVSARCSEIQNSCDRVFRDKEVPATVWGYRPAAIANAASACAICNPAYRDEAEKLVRAAGAINEVLEDVKRKNPDPPGK